MQSALITKALESLVFVAASPRGVSGRSAELSRRVSLNEITP